MTKIEIQQGNIHAKVKGSRPQHNVQVHRLITRATFEERINDMIQSKRNLADMTVGSGEKSIGNLINNELKDVFSLG